MIGFRSAEEWRFRFSQTILAERDAAIKEVGKPLICERYHVACVTSPSGFP